MKDLISPGRYLFLTVGLGSIEMVQAAERLAADAKTLEVFSEVVVITETNLFEIMPEIVQLVPSTQWNSDSKFGFFIWKPVIAKLALEGHWGEFDAVCFLDAGCEILPTYWSRKSMIYYLKKAMDLGAVVFSSLAEEIRYTKSRVFDLFPNLDRNDFSSQIAGGSWYLAGEKGRAIAHDWAQLSTSNYLNINEELSSDDESEFFLSPRHDQSIFSLLCKSYLVQPEARIPPGGGQGIRTQIRGIFFPFRWARNRSGLSINSKLLRNFGAFTLEVYFLSKRVSNLRRTKPFRHAV